MSHGKWTDEQWEAIDIHGCDLLVAAAAGSGKTAVLVERIINMITRGENPVDIDRLLVVTFTNAAASEMRERIGDALVKKINEFPENQHFQKQLTLLNKAKITTIHSFCLDVVRNNYNIIGIDPAFRIADTAEINLLKSETVDELFEELYSAEGNDMFLQLVECYGDDTRDLKLKELIINIHSFVQSSPFPKKWLYDMAEKYNPLNIQKDYTNPWTSFIVEIIRFELEGFISSNQLALKIINSPDGPKEYLSSNISDYDILKLLIKRSYEGFESLYNEFQNVKFSSIGRKKPSTDPQLADMVLNLRKEVKSGIEDLKKKIFFKSPKSLIEDIKNLYPIVKELGKVVMLFSDKFQTAKKEKLITDFNDLEHYCLNILLEEGSTSEKPLPSKAALDLQKMYIEVLTDEYQDSNMVQEMILSVVSRSENGSDNNNRFMVGDVKQSIYRFRLANPKIFTEKYDTFSTDGTGSKRRIDLFKNFRSRPNILNGINFLFKQLMTKDLGEILYDDKAALNAGAVFEENESQNPCGGAIELNLLDFSDVQNDEYYDDLNEEEEEISNAEAEAVFIGKRIYELIKSGFEVVDKDTRKYRGVEFRDIVVLLRSPKSWGFLAAGKLMEMGIPAYAAESDEYFETAEVMTILSFLEIIDNPRQDIPLLAVLRSPIYRFTGNEIIEIKSENEKLSFYDCILNYSENLDNEISQRLKEFLNDINKFRSISVNISITQLLWKLYNDTGYFDYVGAMAGGIIRQSNLKILIDKAQEYENSSFKGLFNFVKYIDKVKNSSNNVDSAKIINEKENIVRIISIHKSKGLEFPVVFVSGLGKKFNIQELSNTVLLHSELGIGSKYINFENRVVYETLPRIAVLKKIMNENLSEELRILYVALTRAKEKLILTGGIKNLDTQLAKWSLNVNNKNIDLPHSSMMKAICFLDWIVPAVSRHRDGELISSKAGINQLPQKNGLYNDISEWKLNIISKNQILFKKYDEQKNNEKLANCIESFDFSKEYSLKKSEIDKKINWEYKNKLEASLPANISISEIKRIFYNERQPNIEVFKFDNVLKLEIPDFLKQEEKLTAAKIGTAVHTVMEKLNFKNQYNYDTIKELIDKLKAHELLSRQQADSIKIKKILNFLNSPLGKRLANADKILKEKSFTIELSPYYIYRNEEYKNIKQGILVRGIIDCFFYEGNDIILIDYKTDYVKEDEEYIILEKYKVQLDIYKRALENITGQKVKESFIYSFSADKAIKTADN